MWLQLVLQLLLVLQYHQHLLYQVDLVDLRHRLHHHLQRENQILFVHQQNLVMVTLVEYFLDKQHQVQHHHVHHQNHLVLEDHYRLR